MKRIGLVLISLAVAACSSPDGSTSSGTGGLTEANSQDVGQQLVSTISGSAGSAGSDGTSRSRPRSNITGEGEECWTEGGDLSDADSDGMPANAIYTYDNCSYSEEGWTESWNGSETYSDPLPDLADFGYDIGMDLTVSYSEETGTYAENDHYSGTANGGFADGAYTSADDLVIDYDGVYEGESYAGSYVEALTYVYTPGSAWTPEAEAVAGLYTVDGSWGYTYDSETVSVDVATTDPLTFDPSCESGFVAGTIVATSGDASETITWNACDDFTIHYEG